jgi:prepilin signal peptidase PulO-like enzyme (type II secretory pathway)
LLGALLGVILIGWSMLVHYQRRRRMLRRAGRSGYRRLSPLTRAFTMKSEMPFAPFMVVGAIVAFLFPNALFSALFLLAAK